ncbi:O-methyltransferase, family 2 [Cladochytrium replicatum]|nr:O-methyltransferase, family 2 [Cladochytrium replicatum]
MIQHFDALIAVAGMAGELWSLRAIIALVNLGVPDELANGPATAEEISEKLKLHAPSVFRAMRGAVYRGFMTVDPATRVFDLTEKGGVLTTSHPYSMVNLVKLYGSPGLWQPWAHAEHSVRTGEVGTIPAFGEDIWSYYAKHPEESAIFSDAMTNYSSTEVEHLIAKYPFADGDPKVIVDVAGGNGAFLKAILEALPNARGILFDLPQVIDNLPADAPAAGHDRIELVGGSFLEPVIPSGGDIYILKHILHDWYDPECVTMLKNIERVMSPGARLLVCEEPHSYGPEGQPMAMLDLTMLVMIGGKERFLEEYEKLFDEAGLKITGVIPTGGVSVIEAMRK